MSSATAAEMPSEPTPPGVSVLAARIVAAIKAGGTPLARGRDSEASRRLAGATPVLRDNRTRRRLRALASRPRIVPSETRRRRAAAW